MTTRSALQSILALIRVSALRSSDERYLKRETPQGAIPRGSLKLTEMVSVGEWGYSR
jgi:hypothetical protein